MSYKNMFGTDTALNKGFKTTELAVISSTAFQAPAQVQSIKPEAREKLLVIQGRASDDIAIAEFGTEAGKKVAELSDTVLQKTTTGKMDEFGKGLTDILTLTEGVDLDDLNLDQNKGVVSKALGFFKKKKVEVTVQFQNTSASIQTIVDNLRVRQQGMQADNAFLETLYQANLTEYHDLGFSIEAAEYVVGDLRNAYETAKVQAETSTDQFFIQSVADQEQKIKRWEKQIDRLKRMQHVALLTAPEIRANQAGNVAMYEKFDDLVATTIPAWKKQLTKIVMQRNLKANADLADKMDEKTNEFFRRAADLSHTNALQVAKSSERSSLDMETLQYMQQKLIDQTRQVKQIQEQGRQDRIKASQNLVELRDTMKKEMLTW